MARYSIIKPRRGTLYENSVNNVLLDEGELIVEVPDTGVGTGLSKFKIGDGHSRYNDLPYAFNGASAAAVFGGSASEASTIQFRSDSTENWEAIDPVLAEGEMGFDTVYKWFKIGDGTSRWTQLSWLRDVTFQEGDPTREIVDFGDEDIMDEAAMEWLPEFNLVDFGDEDEEPEDDPYALSSPSVNFNLATGATEYMDKILPDNWNDKIYHDIVDPDIPDPEPPVVDPDNPDNPNPDNPDNPDTPDNPDNPDTPDNPDNPDPGPVTPVEPDPPTPVEPDPIQPEPTPPPTPPTPTVPVDITPMQVVVVDPYDEEDDNLGGIEEPAEEAEDDNTYEPEDGDSNVSWL